MSTLQFDQAVADKMVEKAIAFCAQKNFAGESHSTRHALSQGRCDICGDVIDSLGGQIGEYLGQMDKTIKAVYRYGPEADIDRLSDGDGSIWLPGQTARARP